MGNARAKYDFESGLSDVYWEAVMSYLDVVSQVRLARVSRRLCGIFRRYAQRRYKHIDERLIQTLSADELEQLLQLVGDQVQSYVKYSGGHEFEQLYRRHFEIIVRNCRQLERFAFYKVLLAPEQLSGQLGQLQHLWMRAEAGALRSQLLAGLSPLQLESLVLRGPPLSAEEVASICQICSLKELDVFSDQAPIEQFLKLPQLEKLHISMPWIRDKQLLQLVSGLPRLHTVYVKNSPLITEQFVRMAHLWIIEFKQVRQKLKIFFYKSAIKWSLIDEAACVESLQFLEIINKEHKLPEPIAALEERKRDSRVKEGRL